MFSYRALRSLVSKNRPPQGTYQYGELYVNLADEQLGVIDENGIPQDLLAITFFKNLAHYSEGDHVIYQGKIYIAKNDIQGPKNFDPNDWSTSGIDLSLADYDEELPYEKGHVAFFPGDNCFLQAAVDIPANTPFDENMWEPICGGKGGAGGGGGYAIGDVVGSFALLDPTEQTERRLVLLWGQELPRVGEYADLFAKWGVQFGNGDGATTFNVPDTRGYAMRGVDDSISVDIDADKRHAMFPGPNVNVGAMGGTYQEDEFKEHLHYWRIDDNTWGFGAYDDNDFESGQRPTENNPGGGETRMKNISIYWYAQY